MKSIKYIVAAAIVAVAGAQASADVAKAKMIVNKADGTKTEINVGEIDPIKFMGNNMLITSGGAPKEMVDVTKVNNITFDMNAGIGEIVSEAFEDGVTVNINGGVINVTTANGADVNVAVYNLSGVCMLQSAGAGEASVDMNPLAQGAYIVKANNKTIKFIR